MPSDTTAPLPAPIADALADATKAPPKDFKALVREVRQRTDKGDTTFVLDGDHVFRIPNPLDWPDELLEMQRQAALRPATADLVGLATAFMGGPDEYAQFKAEGGSAIQFQAVLEDLMGETLGESAAS